MKQERTDANIKLLLEQFKTGQSTTAEFRVLVHETETVALAIDAAMVCP